MSFVSGDDVDFVAFDFALQGRSRLTSDNAGTQLTGHVMGVAGREVKLLCDLLIGQVQPHEVEAEYPDAQRLMMVGEDRSGQVIEVAAASLAMVALALVLRLIAPALDDLN